MRFSEDTEYLIRLDSTAMADIIFNLLIFFLLSSSFLLDSGLQLELPKMVRPVALPAREVVVTLTRDERLFVNDTPADWSGMEAELARALEGAELRRVVIRGDRGVPLGRVVEIMDAARRSGAEALAIAANPLDGEPVDAPQRRR